MRIHCLPACVAEHSPFFECLRKHRAQKSLLPGLEEAAALVTFQYSELQHLIYHNSMRTAATAYWWHFPPLSTSQGEMHGNLPLLGAGLRISACAEFIASLQDSRAHQGRAQVAVVKNQCLAWQPRARTLQRTMEFGEHERRWRRREQWECEPE